MMTSSLMPALALTLLHRQSLLQSLQAAAAASVSAADLRFAPAAAEALATAVSAEEAVALRPRLPALRSDASSCARTGSRPRARCRRHRRPSTCEQTCANPGARRRRRGPIPEAAPLLVLVLVLGCCQWVDGPRGLDLVAASPWAEAWALQHLETCRPSVVAARIRRHWEPALLLWPRLTRAAAWPSLSHGCLPRQPRRRSNTPAVPPDLTSARQQGPVVATFHQPLCRCHPVLQCFRCTRTPMPPVRLESCLLPAAMVAQEAS